MFDLTGKCALVTGAGQNTGAGIARALAGQGAHVVVNDLVGERADEVMRSIEYSGGSAQALVFDVTDLEAIRTGLESVPPTDILVSNAGNAGAEQMVPQAFHETAPHSWTAPIEVNLTGVMHGVHATIGHMIDQSWGRIITISSGAGTHGVGIGVAPYSAGKGAGVAFTRSIALENASHGVTANSVAIGLMDNVGDADVVAALAGAIPAGRLGNPADVGAACVYLASDEAAWITGQTIGLNGGQLTS